MVIADELVIQGHVRHKCVYDWDRGHYAQFSPEHYVLHRISSTCEDADCDWPHLEGVFLKIHDDKCHVLNAFGPLPESVYRSENGAMRMGINIADILPYQMWHGPFDDHAREEWDRIEETLTYWDKDVRWEFIALYALTYDNFKLSWYDEAQPCGDAA